MSEKRFKLSKYVTPSSVSNFCDENGRMLNKEVVKVLNEQQDLIFKLDQENQYLFGARIREQEEFEKCTDKLKSDIRATRQTISALQKELKDCEKFRYMVFKRMGEYER